MAVAVAGHKNHCSICTVETYAYHAPGDSLYQKLKIRSKGAACYVFKTAADVVYQTVNVMFDCHDPSVNGYDYHSLMNVGVNIFNVDLTRHDTKFFNIVKESLLSCEKIAEMFPTGFYRPASLSVMMSVKEPLEVDERVDIIILKDITEADEMRQFRKRNKKFSSVPILLWPPDLRIEDLNELIKISDGIILDQSFNDSMCGIVHVLQAAKDAYKPVFHIEPNLLQEFHEDSSRAQLRRVLTYSQNIITYGLDGVIIVDYVGKSPTFMVQCLVKAIEIAQKDVERDKEYCKRSLQIPIPALPPKSAAFGASMAALKGKAKAILVLTMTGASARILANTSPPCRIVAITAHITTARRMHLYKKVIPLYYKKKRQASWHVERWARVAFGTQFGLEIGLFNFAAKLVVLAPMEEGVGYCDCFHVVKVADVVHSPYCSA